jgi:hypothetical protein
MYAPDRFYPPKHYCPGKNKIRLHGKPVDEVREQGFGRKAGTDETEMHRNLIF